MARDNKTEADRAALNKDEQKADNAAASGQQSQLQSTSAETEQKVDNDPAEKARKDNEPQFFDTTIAKIKVVDGEEIVVMSDHLDPGERLKRDVDAEKAEKKAKKVKDDNAKDSK